MQILIDVLGYIVTGISIVSVQFKKRWKMLVGSFLVNLISAVSVFLDCGVTSAFMLNCVGASQCAINAALAYRDKVASRIQMIVFTVVFFAAGVMRYNQPLDILPIIGSMLFMVSKFQKSEQLMRIFGMLSSFSWIGYYIVGESTLIYSQIVILCSTLIALYRYRKKARLF